MNDARRKEIQRALTLIGEAKGILELALSQEQDDLDNMPEDLKGDEAGQRAEEAVEDWSVPRWAAAMRLPPVRRRCRISTNHRRQNARRISAAGIGRVIRGLIEVTLFD